MVRLHGGNVADYMKARAEASLTTLAINYAIKRHDDLTTVDRPASKHKAPPPRKKPRIKPPPKRWRRGR